MIVTVYIDESGTHDSGVTIMAGWVGNVGQWRGFDEKWRGLLKKNRLTHFHSKPFRHTQDEFKGWPVIRKRVFQQTAADIGMRHLAFGFTIALPEATYLNHYVAGERPKKIPLDSRYGLCFRHCLSYVPNLAKERFTGQNVNINFVLESGHKNAGDALRIFNKVKMQRLHEPEEQAIVDLLGTIEFDDKKMFPGLQVADIAAYSSFQHESGAQVLEVGEVPIHGTIKAARKIQNVPVFRLEILEKEAALYKQFILKEIEDRAARNRKPTSSGPPPFGGQPS